MNCLGQFIRRGARRHEEYERPTCVHCTAPLMGEVVGTVVSPSTVFATCCAQASQALASAPPAVCPPVPSAPGQQSMPVLATPSQEFDLNTGARYVDAPYTGTYFLQGLKYYDPVTGRCMVVQSTNVSTRFAEYRHSVPYKQYAVYASWEEDHTRDDGGGMSHSPTFMTCDPKPRMFGDLFDFPDMHRCRCMEDVLEAAGIEDYHRFICGYHIKGMGKSHVDEKFCPLDWYYQSASLRLKYPDQWDHYLILDQVCPADFWKGTILQQLGRYEWPNHRIGCDASWSEQAE